MLSAIAAAGVVDNVINMSGVAQARSVKESKGNIILAGGDTGKVSVSGRMDVSAVTHSFSDGGTIKVLGNHIEVHSPAAVDASAIDDGSDGGEILIGGNYQGQGPEQNAQTTTVESGATVAANAGRTGDGGRIIVWADDTTAFHGKISARGGSVSGDGGFVETSGHRYLNVDGIKIDLAAANGSAGTWLLDQTDLTISGDATANVTMGGSPTSTYTGNNSSTTSTLNVTDLVNALANASITVLTGAGGAGEGSGDITVSSAITWSSANSLTLSAYRSITVNQNITNDGGASVVLRADNTGTGTGTVNAFAADKTVTLSGGSGTVTIFYNPTTFGTQDAAPYTGGTTPTQYMLVNSLGTLTDAATVSSLGALSNSSNTALWNKNYALGKNIDASATSGWGSGAGFSPIGNSTTKFTGKFDGQSYTIDGLFINSSGSNVGLFGYANSSALIKNIGVTNVNVTGVNAVGALVGLHSTGTISNAYSTGTVVATHASSALAGGLVGQADNMAISGSYSTASVSGYDTVGGLVGYGTSANTIASSYATGNVTGTGGAGMGGLVGNQDGAVTSSYATGTVTGGSYTGGLIGVTAGAVTSSYATGSVTSTGNYVGGLIGWTESGVAIT